MEQRTEQVFHTAAEWARRTGVPYRSILNAVSAGDLPAIRPSKTIQGCILISESSWERWLVEVEVKKRVPDRLPPRPGQRSARLSDLAAV